MTALELAEQLTKLVRQIGHDPEVSVLVPYYCTDWGNIRATTYYIDEVDMNKDGHAELRLEGWKEVMK